VDDFGDKRGLLPRFTLKDGDSFLVADALGDIHSRTDGLFTNDTRMLSRFELSIAGHPTSLLGAAISQDNALFTSHLTNRPLAATGENAIPQGVIHLERMRLLWDHHLYERIRLTNFADIDTEVPIQLAFGADFADIFEVQGHQRSARGEYLAPEIGADLVTLAYRGSDGLERTTRLAFAPRPVAIDRDHVEFRVLVARGDRTDLYVQIGPAAAVAPDAERFEAAALALDNSMQERLRATSSMRTSGRLFNQWIEKSRSDLALLTTQLPTGPYPYAGIPWFATQFGRDAIVTALQTLWINPSLAAGVLAFLASTQAHETSTFRDSEPGKIMHETRRGEMAKLGEVPFGRYYGGVDTTPLFVMLAGAYVSRTGDTQLIDDIWPALLAATQWIERRLTASPTGFLDYAAGERSGLVNQAWKDSQDSMFHADGRFPDGPLAVVEVQGYAYAALATMGRLGATRADADRASRWADEAVRLRRAIEEKFWIPEMNFYAIAIDGEGTPCRVFGSNAGHLLFCGVPNAERAAIVSAQLLSDRFCSGWGIRTLAEGEARYNPMSYHNGSVWPHDTSICAAGMSRYGARENAVRILSDLYETAIHFNMRLPELYCGFARRPGQGPTPYPVACLPQAWASGAVFLLLQASLGIEVEGGDRSVHVSRPTLPEGIEELTVHDLEVRDARIDLQFTRVDEHVVVVPSGHVAGDVRVLVHL
jgi:glycogen debranching enzyme